MRRQASQGGYLTAAFADRAVHTSTPIPTAARSAWRPQCGAFESKETPLASSRDCRRLCTPGMCASSALTTASCNYIQMSEVVYPRELIDMQIFAFLVQLPQ